jgi:hypothetical protein
VWELGIGIAPANPIKYQYCIWLAQDSWVGLSLHFKQPESPTSPPPLTISTPTSTRVATLVGDAFPKQPSTLHATAWARPLQPINHTQTVPHTNTAPVYKPSFLAPCPRWETVSNSPFILGRGPTRLPLGCCSVGLLVQVFLSDTETLVHVSTWDFNPSRLHYNKYYYIYSLNY